ncbi:MAG TPA: hypothetical protein VNU71_05375 [Burkholderiaceae bacterium]|nr:hypothetical protein [Burkholderiaceae bacterium]
MTHPTASARLTATHRLALVATSGVVALLAGTPAHAIERCRVDGQLVLQSTPCPQPAAPKAPLVDASSAEPVAKRSLADAMREREADIRTRSSKREAPPIDGASILKARMGAL